MVASVRLAFHSRFFFFFLLFFAFAAFIEVDLRARAGGRPNQVSGSDQANGLVDLFDFRGLPLADGDRQRSLRGPTRTLPCLISQPEIAAVHLFEGPAARRDTPIISRASGEIARVIFFADLTSA